MKKCSIDKKSIDVIASKLVNAGYHGQEMEVLSCDSGLFYKSKSICTEFIRYFKSYGIENPKIICDAYGKTIITSTSRDSDKVGCWVVYDKRTDYAGSLQGRYLQKKKMKNISNTTLLFSDYFYTELFKSKLIKYFSNKIRWYDMLIYSSKLCMLGGFSLTCVLMLILDIIYSIGNTINSSIYNPMPVLVISFLILTVCMIMIGKKEEAEVSIIDNTILFILSGIVTLFMCICLSFKIGGYVLLPLTILGLLVVLFYFVSLLCKEL